MAAVKLVDARMTWQSLMVTSCHNLNPQKGFGFDPGVLHPHIPYSCLTADLYNSGAHKIFLQEFVLLDHVLNLILRILLIYK